MPGLEGKIALVTGAARGIGRAIAEQFIAEGVELNIDGGILVGSSAAPSQN